MSKKIALITGASSGIGEVFARKLAQCQHDLVLVARRQDRLEAIAAALSETYAVRCEVIVCDLSVAHAARELFAQSQALGLEVEVLVNNAAFGLIGPFTDQPVERIMQLLALNVATLTELTHRFLPGMLQRGSGCIVNVASTAAFQALPYFAVYAASKAYVMHFTEALAQEIEGRGVVVTCLCPGPTDTEFSSVAGFSTAAAKWAHALPEMVVDAALTGMRRGQSLVIPGALNQLQTKLVRFIPRSIVRRAASRFFRHSFT